MLPLGSVADPHHVDADPDPAFHFDADPDLDPRIQILLSTRDGEKKNFNFG